MPTFTSALQLYNHQKAMFARRSQTVRQMHGDVARGGWQDARDATAGAAPSGRARKRWLRKHRPFARLNLSLRGKGGRVNALPIGAITGRLHRSMRLTRRSETVYELRAGTPYAKYILDDRGTRKMVGRGFQKMLRTRHKARNKAFVDTVKNRF